MCVSCGPRVFLPFLPRCMEEIWPLLEYPHEDIRREAVGAISKFCAAYYIELDQVCDVYFSPKKNCPKKIYLELTYQGQKRGLGAKNKRGNFLESLTKPLF